LKNGSFTLKKYQMFSVDMASEEVKNATILDHLIYVCGKLSQGNHVIIVTSSFRKAPVSKCFPSTPKQKRVTLPQSYFFFLAAALD